MPCCNCTGPAHPATGHHLAGDLWLCGPCAGRFWAWVIRHTRSKARRGRAPDAIGFYVAAATSVGAGQ